MPDQGNVVIVTGANRGIGLAIAERLSHDRYEIAACVRSRSSELEQLLYQSDDQNDRHKIFEMDLANKDSIREAVKSIFAWKRQVVALVNCAGMAQGSLFSMTRMTDLQTVFEVNYFAQIYLTQLVVKKMIRAKSGSIVNIASTAGILADAGTLSYGCSKAALIHASKIMATELGVYGIRVIDPCFLV
ncbi:MAG: SDR family NAD(P)-dependent oxidoreductase [Gammaproteobacteria bacterium]